MKVVALLLVVVVLVVVTALGAATRTLPAEGCEPQDQWAGWWDGQPLPLTVWVPPQPSPAAIILSLTLEAREPTRGPDYLSVSFVNLTAYVVRVSGHNETAWEVEVEEGLGTGWVELWLTRHVHNTVRLATAHLSSPLLTLRAPASPHSLDITASNLTVNCTSHGAPRVGSRKGKILALCTLVLVFVGILAIMASSACTCNLPKLKKKRGVEVRFQTPLQPLLQQTPSPCHSSTTTPLAHVSPFALFTHEEPTLWEAVAEGDLDEVQRLVEEAGCDPDQMEPGRHSSPLTDAHNLGHKDILQVFSKHKGERPGVPQDSLVKAALQEWEQATSKLWVAAECGMYEHEGGVSALLKSRRFPGTFRDTLGRTLLHYMSSPTVMDGRPPWQPRYIGLFLANQEHFINAVDHWGRTALHQLAPHPTTAEEDILWRGREWTMQEAWLEVARLLVGAGCDPRIPDHQGRLPHQLAKDANNNMLAEFLQQKCQELGKVEGAAAAGRHGELVEAARQGDTGYLLQLLQEGVPLLPASARSDPLVEAIRHGQRDAVLLLLSAGAPLCSRVAGVITPLEAAHTTRGLPALLPAILRKDLSDRLESEMSAIGTEGEYLPWLREGLRTYHDQVVDVGIHAKWIYRQRDEAGRGQEARLLLREAVRLGLSLTCQVLGLDHTCLHSLPPYPSPFLDASTSTNLNTQIVLYRDLRMSPYACEVSLLETLPLTLKDYMWVNEILMLEFICSSETNGSFRTQIQLFCHDIKNLKNSLKNNINMKELDSYMLYLLARHGLVTLLHTYLSSVEGADVNQEVELCPGGTMLHVAAMYGQPGVVEYLVRRGGNLRQEAAGSLTPAHLAAMSGHHACLHYLLAHMTHPGVMPEGAALTTGHLSSRYDDMCAHHEFPLLSPEDVLCVLNEDGEEHQASELLRRKGGILGINLPEDLLRAAIESVTDSSLLQEITKCVTEETENLCKQISDERFQGKLIPVSSVVERTASVNVHHVTFLYEVHTVSTQDGRPISTVQYNEDEDKIVILVSGESGNELFNGGNFRESFSQSLWALVKLYATLNNDISLAPPFFSQTSSGVCLYFMWNKESKMKYISVAITPALPAHNSLSQHFRQPLSSDLECPGMHLTNLEEEWVCVAPRYETGILKTLVSDPLIGNVWRVCQFLNQLLQTPWWVSSLGGDMAAAQLARCLRVQPLPEAVLRSLFLQELREATQWSGDKNLLLRRVVSVFCRVAKKDMRNKWVPKEQVPSFLLQSQRCSQVTPAVCGVITYLEELHLAHQKKTPKVTFT